MTAEWVAFVNAVAWPLVVLIILIALRAPLTKFVSELGGRATKVSIFQFAVELATVPEFKPSYRVGSEDLRSLTPSSVFDSATTTLFEQISDDSASDYAIIDLGKEHQWLTSRLYIFAVMLGRMRNLKCFVFVETQGETRKLFLGTASPERVRWALARSYPWLEAAFAQAYAGIAPNPPNMAVMPFILSDQGALVPYQANDLARAYVAAIQQVAPPVTNDEEWITLIDPQQVQYWEHTAWLDGDLRHRFLETTLQTASFVDSVDVPAETRVRAVLRRGGEFVALTDQRGVFQALVDREQLLEQVAAKLAAPA